MARGSSAEPNTWPPLTRICRLCGEWARLREARSDIALYRCKTCGFVSGQPTKDASAAERYGHYYRGDPPPAPNYRYHEWLGRVEAQVGVGHLLEVGAGSGGFVQVALERGWAVDATEVAPEGARRLQTLGARVFQGDVGEADYPIGQFDLVVSLEVVEHLPLPGTHLEGIARATRLGGVLLLSTPNFAGVSRRSLGLRWRAIGPEHLGYFTPRVLAKAARGAGYASVTVRSRSIDLSAWRGPHARGGVPQFDPVASAKLRDAVESKRQLRAAKEVVNWLLGRTGLGDSLLLWAQR